MSPPRASLRAERARRAQNPEEGDLPIPEAAPREPHTGLVEQLRERGQRPVLHLAAAEVEDDPAAVLRQRTIEQLAGVVQAQLALQTQLAVASVLDAVDAHVQDLVNCRVRAE